MGDGGVGWAGLVRKARKAADAAGLSLGGRRGAARRVAMETGWVTSCWLQRAEQTLLLD